MPLGLWNVEWLNLNSQRRYPLTGDSTGTDVTGSFTLPDDFLLELDLPVSAGNDVDPARFFLLHLGAYATGYFLTVGYQPAAGDPVQVANALIPRQTHVRNSTYALGGVGDFDDTMGKVAVGALDDADQQPPGFYTFTLESARLEPDAVRPQIRGVSGLVVVNGDQRSAPLRGDVELVAGSNVRLDVILAAGRDPVVRINAVSGEGTVEDCVCAGDAAPSPPILRINGVAPTLAGDFALVGGECVQDETIPNGLRLIDTCSKPCCGCAELERITQDLGRLAAQAATVADFVSRLEVAVDTMETVVLGSRLGGGCVVC